MSNPVPRQESQPVFLSRLELVCRWLVALLTPSNCRSMIYSYKMVRLIIIGYLFTVSVYKRKKWVVIPKIGDSVSEYYYENCDGSSPSAAGGSGGKGWAALTITTFKCCRHHFRVLDKLCLPFLLCKKQSNAHHHLPSHPTELFSCDSFSSSHE